MNSQARSLKQNTAALAAGVLVGIALVTAFGFLSASRDAILSPASNAEASFLLSVGYAPVIAILSVPFWLVILRLRLEGPVAAASLGFVMTSAVWFLANQPFLGPTIDDLGIAACGAAAGLTTWWVANRR